MKNLLEVRKDYAVTHIFNVMTKMIGKYMYMELFVLEYNVFYLSPISRGPVDREPGC